MNIENVKGLLNGAVLRLNLMLGALIKTGLILACVALSPTVHAQVEEFYIPVDESDALDFFNDVAIGQSPNFTGPNTRTDIVIREINTEIVFDPSTNGYESDYSIAGEAGWATGVFGVATERWGDGDCTNGFNPNLASCSGSQDVFSVGEVLVFDNSQVNAGDYFQANETINLTRSMWPEGTYSGGDVGTFLAGAFELFPTTQYGTSYLVPIGENTPGSSDMFEGVAISIMASEDNTTITFDPDGPTSNAVTPITQILNRGESVQYGSGAGANGIGLVISEGATVLSTSPIQVNVLTGDLATTFEARFYTLFPDALLSDSYYEAVGTTVAADEVVVFLFNPNSSAIDVQTFDNTSPDTATSTINIAANSSQTFTMPSGGTLTGVRFSSTGGEVFSAYTTVDFGDIIKDWGHVTTPERLMGDTIRVGFAPGNDPDSANALNASPIWVVADIDDLTLPGVSVTDQIQICVDAEGDGIAANTDTTNALSTSQTGRQYDYSVTLNRLDSGRLYRQGTTQANNGLDQTGMLAFACDPSNSATIADPINTIIAAAYGQDPAFTASGDSGFDVGTTIRTSSDNRLFVGDLVFVDIDGDGVQDIGEVGLANVDVTITTTDVNVDVDHTIGGVQNTFTIQTDANGIYLFDRLTEGADYTITVSPPLGLTQTFDPDAVLDNTTTIAVLTSSTLTQDFGYRPSLTIEKVSDTGGNPVSPGDEIEYTITVTNNTTVTQTNVTLTDTLPAGVTYVAASASKTYPTTVGGSSGTFTSPNLGPLNVDGDNPASVSYTTSTATDGIPAGATLVDYEFNVQGDTQGSSWLAEIQLETTSPTATLFDLDFGVDLGYPNSGGSYNETEGPITASGTAIGAFGFTFDEDLDDGGAGTIDNIVSDITFTINWSEAGTRSNVTDAANAPANMVTAADNITLLSGESMTVVFRVTVDNPFTASTTLTNQAEADSAESLPVTDDVMDTVITTGSITGNVSQDTTGNGTGDTALSGATVLLYSDPNGDGDPADGTLISSTTTDGSGDYAFNSVTAGDYVLVEVDPAGVRSISDGDSSADAGGDAANGAAPLGLLDNLIPVSVDAGETDADNNFVDAAIASVEGTVWFDEDLDGIQDIEESGITGVTVQLIDSLNAVIATVVTDANGDYSFDNVLPGDYTVNVIDGAGTPLADLDNTAGVGGVDPKAITVASGDHITDVDFGYIPEPNEGAIGDRVWADANANGIQDPGEAGIAGVVLTLTDKDGNTVGSTVTTNANGDYLFTGVPFGEDYVVSINPVDAALSGYTPTVGPQSEGGYIGNPVTLVATLRVVTDIDFGFDNNLLNTIRDTVWFDENGDGIKDVGEAGIANVTIDIINASGDIVATSVTDENGDVAFSGLPDGNYRLVVTDNNDEIGLFNGTTAEGVARLSDLVGVAGGVDVNDDSFGYNNPGLIAGTVYSDTNNNSDQDSGELGITGQTVTLLLDADNNGSFETTVSSVLTDATGSYQFDGLIPGSYQVVVTPPGGTQTEDPDVIVDDQTNIVLGIGESSVGNDFGYTDVSGLFGLSGTVFLDPDKNGVEDAGEPGFEGVTLALLNNVGSGTVLATTVTDANGDYAFTGLPNGDYSVAVTDSAAILAGYDITSGLDVQSRTINNANETDVDFGYIKEEATASIAGEVWVDEDSDGIADDDELNLSDVDVYLCRSPLIGVGVTFPDNTLRFRRYDAPLTIASVDQIETIGTLTSDTTSSTFDILAGDTFGDGYGYIYSGFFNAATAGTYTFETTSDDGSTIVIDGSEIVDNDAIQAFTTVSNTVELSAGYHAIEVRYFERDGGNVFSARFANPGGSLADLSTATLSTVADICHPFHPNYVATATTDANGDYLFTDLPPGQYTLDTDPSDIPDGLAETVDPTPPSSPISLSEGESVTEVDFGHEGTGTNPGVLSGFVWTDADGNSLYDSGETPIGGVTIRVYNSTSLIATTTTNSDGSWIVTGIPVPDAATADDLLVTYEPTDIPANLDAAQPTNFSTGNDRYTDVDLFSDDNNNIGNLDFGFEPAIGSDLGSIAGTVYSEITGSGTDNAYDVGADTPIEGVKINLIDDSTGGVIATTITDAEGNYSFDGLQDGDYRVVIIGSENNALQDLNPNTDTLETEGTAGVITIAVGSDYMDADAGFVSDLRLGSVGNRFWYDSNGDGIVDDDEPGIEGIIIQCWLDGDNSETPNDPAAGASGAPVPGIDNLIRTVTTDENGEYYCTSLPTGQYIVLVADSGDFVEADDATSYSGPNPANDGFAKPWTYALTTQSPNYTADFGVTGSNSISGTVFIEDSSLVEPDGNTTIESTELDGVVGGNADTGANAVPVVLYVEVNGQFVELTSTVTNPDGTYLFDSLPDGNYRVEVQPQGSVIDGFGQTGDPDLAAVATNPEQLVCDSPTASLCDNQTGTAIVLSGSNATGIDFGYQENFVTTPVTITYFKVESTGGGVIFTWQTANEVGHLGYQLYARTADDWVLLNDELILSEGGSAMDVRTHSYTAYNVDAKWFALVDVSTNEELTLHGPYQLGTTTGQALVETEAFDWGEIELVTPSQSEVRDSVNSRLQRLLEIDEREQRTTVQ